MARVLVVGGGFGGLAAAARLVRLGHEVTVAERGPTLGRPLARLSRHGVDLDAGTGAITLPAVLRDLFHKSGGPLDGVLELVPVDPAVRLAPTGVTPVDLPSSSRAGAAQALRQAYDDRTAERWTDLGEQGQRAWELLLPRLYEPERPLPPWYARSQRRALAAATPLRRVTARDLGRSAGAGGTALRTYVEHLAHEAGFAPGAAPAAVLALAYVEETFGVWRVTGGAHQLVAALVERVTARGRGSVRTQVAPDETAQLLARADVVVHDRSAAVPRQQSLLLLLDDDARTDAPAERTVLAADLSVWAPRDPQLRPSGRRPWTVHAPPGTTARDLLDELDTRGIVPRHQVHAAEVLETDDGPATVEPPRHPSLHTVAGSPVLGGGLPLLGMSAARCATLIGRA